MAGTSFVQKSFLGGEWSQSAQGDTDHPFYRKAMNVCLNTIPMESNAALRRPGTRHAGTTRGGLPGRVIRFDFEQDFPYGMEFTQGKLRFRAGLALVTTNDDVAITSISAANPAVVTTAAAHGWASGQAYFPAINVPRLQNRAVAFTVLSPTTFSIADAVTGATINGATLGTFTAGTVARILELTTPYAAQTWANLRSVQAETTAVLLNGTHPQVLTVETLPNAQQYATFALTPSDFRDGPYLKAVPGSYITSSDLNGNVTLTLSFQPWDSSISYDFDDYVTSAGQGYRSIDRTGTNVNDVPATSPDKWVPVNGGDPINGGAGFTSADIGRLVRLFSEPPIWSSSATYAAKQTVAYADGNGTFGYWTATGPISAGIQPGTSTLWAVNATGAIWTWARILSIATAGSATPDSTFGTMTNGGGVASAFDGNTSKSFASAAGATSSTTTYPAWVATFYNAGAVPKPRVQYQGYIYEKVSNSLDAHELWPPNIPSGLWTAISGVVDIAIDASVGAQYTSGKIVSSVTLYPTVDIGFTNGVFVAFNLRTKATAPSSPSDGALIGSSGFIGNTFSPITITSIDTTTSSHYVWIEALANFTQPLPDDGSHVFTGRVGIAQMVVSTPNVANGSVITAQIAGPPLLYSSVIRKWRLGVFGGANGWPKNGTYHEGRLWLSGVVGNRVDSSKSNDIFNFAPTAPSGAVADDNGISIVADGPDVNTIFWMVPDQQGIIAGTLAGEWLIAPAAPGAMAPANISMRRVTKIGGANIEPRRTEHTLAFVQKYGRKIMEYFADVVSGKFSAPNLSEKAKHLTASNVVEIAYQQELAPIVWGRLGNGTLIGTTYKRDSLTTSQGPTFMAGHRHTLGSGRSIISISGGASDDGNLDSLSLVTQGADGVCHVEVMAKLLDEGFSFSDVWFVDDGMAPSSYSVSSAPVTGAPYGGATLNGLWAHNGKTVSAYLIGLDCGDYLVTNGSIFVPFGDGVSAGTAGGLFTPELIQPYVDNGLTPPMAVGFTFTSRGQIVRTATPAESGAQAGPAFGKLRRTHQYAAQLYGAVNGSISFGVDFAAMIPANLQHPDGAAYTTQEYFNGIHQDTIEADDDYDNMLCWEITRPHPAFVIAIGGFLNTKDK